MPVGVTVAVITQTLRINACVDFINAIGGDPAVTVFTGDPGALKGADLPVGTSIETSSAPDLLLADPARLRQVGRRRLLGWMRSGSKIGRLSERAARKLLRWVRPVKDPSTHNPGAVATLPANTYLIGALETLHETTRLSTIAVFDVFDLPSVMEFASRSGVRVIVR